MDVWNNGKMAGTTAETRTAQSFKKPLIKECTLKHAGDSDYGLGYIFLN